MPRYLERPTAERSEADPSVALPYGMTANGVVAVVNDLYAYLSALNRASIDHGYGRLEEVMQPAGFSGLISQIVVHSLAREFSSSSPGLAVNLYPNGRPDLVPRATYPDDRIKNGGEGVEVKVSGTRASWQGHNPERGWIAIVQLAIDRESQPVYDRAPTLVEGVLVARLEEEDWTFSGRREGSRRTPTASINVHGRTKLERGRVYARHRS